ncbi:bifunctional folylpolyglutamate synthase/dihydrofolate synthase [Aureibacillus halotolerans]|uniref:tetrahydrofolate synthase n=1 Tax=Aureibacillus halotolerans TaxID=1508390 RepID=A0A4R6U0Y8_9BACI|nr:folylpolyglutamate synthase/dihydrofolate synthase family protein [Aureibacillus halotolerans]TDQ37955.1 dihydrofolate synthase/folylpolyglutamate synthase [Aureibacillus halotolerans]
MTYEEAYQVLKNRAAFGIKPGLARMERLLAEAGHPERALPVIHIAGTNGKGSTLRMLSSVLMASGYRVGAMTSPALSHYLDQLSINHLPIEEDTFADIVAEGEALASRLNWEDIGEPTEYEMLALVFFMWMADEGAVDVLLVETGLGGRLDMTNVVDPILSIITTVGLDHEAILGHTIQAIASEKAGIIKLNRPVISGVLEPEASNVIRQKAAQMNSVLLEIGHFFSVKKAAKHKEGVTFTYKSDQAQDEKSYVVGMHGLYQAHNASLAVTAARYLLNKTDFTNISERSIESGLQHVSWPGRFERLLNEPALYLDGAHNPPAAKALVETIQAIWPNQPVRMLVAVFADKQIDAMLDVFKPLKGELILTTFSHPRAINQDDLEAVGARANVAVATKWRDVLRRWFQEPGAPMIVTGSLTFVQEVREGIHEIQQEKSSKE